MVSDSTFAWGILFLSGIIIWSVGFHDDETLLCVFGIVLVFLSGITVLIL